MNCLSTQDAQQIETICKNFYEKSVNITNTENMDKKTRITVLEQLVDVLVEKRKYMEAYVLFTCLFIYDNKQITTKSDVKLANIMFHSGIYKSSIKIYENLLEKEPNNHLYIQRYNECKDKTQIIT